MTVKVRCRYCSFEADAEGHAEGGFILMLHGIAEHRDKVDELIKRKEG